MGRLVFQLPLVSSVLLRSNYAGSTGSGRPIKMAFTDQKSAGLNLDQGGAIVFIWRMALKAD